MVCHHMPPASWFTAPIQRDQLAFIRISPFSRYGRRRGGSATPLQHIVREACCLFRTRRYLRYRWINGRKTRYGGPTTSAGSSVIIPSPCASAMVALVGFERLTMKVSFASLSVSLLTRTVI